MDNDIWDQMTSTRKRNCTAIHVKGHADRKKKKAELTEHEHLNITTDRIAEQMYNRAQRLESEYGEGCFYERTEATTMNMRPGDCTIRGHRVTGCNTKAIMEYIGTEAALAYWMKDWEKFSAEHCGEADVIQVDEILMRSIQKGELHMPSIGTYTKILHGVLATNHILTQRNDPSVSTDKCECCASQDLETKTTIR